MATIQTIDNELASAVRPKLNANFQALKTEVEAATTAIAGKETAGAASTAVAAHVAASDPHPNYALESDVTSALAGKAAASHGHAIGDTSGLQTALDAKAPTANAPLTGNTSYERTSPSIHNHGNIASGTLTLHATIGSNRANLTGTALTVAFPSGAARALQSLLLTSSNAAEGAITIPSSRSLNSGSTITSFTIPAGGAALLTWFYDGTTYFLIGETLTAAQVKAALAITIADTTGTVPVTRGGTGLTALGSALQVLRVNAAGTAFEFADATAGSGDVSAASNFGTDNRVVRSDGTTKGVQGSGVEIDDSGNVNVLGDGVQGSVTLADAHATDPKSISITVPATITNPYRLVLPGVIPTVGQGLRVASVTGEVVALENATIPSGGLTSYATASLPASPGTGATALCTDCLTISGTAGAPVYYDGTKWRIIGTLIEATTSKLTFARSLAATYGGSLRSDYCTAGNLLSMPTTYGTFGGASQTVGGATVHQMVELYVGSGAHASARWPYLAIPNPSSSTYNGGFYLGFSVRVDYVSDATDEYAAWFGITDQSAWGSGHPAAANMIAVGYDRGNSSTLNSGNSANFILLTRASSTNNYSSVSSVPISTSLSSPSLIEIYQSNGAAPPVVYINNDAGTTLTGTLPSVALYPWFGVLKTAGSFGRTVQLPRAFFMRF